ncbi:hypothetical protein [Nocardia nova]|uniref:Uncharacterized protein n=1 Tax=Nocardia nova SH22a TaxID=1415166 RepID=W5TJ05_9NOCA|nr:hypothetical protein [Nocardia nova]AHH17236.1 hypothetical protein NONO_c24400 [Nocardia nova SH22a]
MSRITLRPMTIALSCAGVGAALAVTPTAAATPTDPIQLAGCDFGRQLTTFDWAGYDEYDQRILDLSTGPFHDQFSASAPDRRAQATSTHTRSEAMSVECRTDVDDPEHPQLLVTVQQSTRSDATLGLPRPQRTSMRVILDHVDGRWLAARVDMLPES